MAEQTFLVGDTVYFAESMRWLRETKVLRVDGDNCVIRFTDNGGIRTRMSKLYATEKEAKTAMAAADKARTALDPPKEEEKPQEPEHSMLYYLQLMT